MRHVLGAIIILIIGAGAGVVARAAWYNEGENLPYMPWVKPPPQVNDNDNTDGGKKTKDVDPPVDTAPDTAGNDCSKKLDNFCVAKLGLVLKHLADADGSAFFIDARESRDFDDGHLAGAIHVPSSDIFPNIDNVRAVVPTSDMRLIVYCGGGHCEASKNVAQVLREYGYTDVWLYENGWEEVEASGRFGDYIENGD